MDHYTVTAILGAGAGAIATTASTSGDKQTNGRTAFQIVGGTLGFTTTLAAINAIGSTSHGCATANACTTDQIMKEEVRKAYVDSLTTDELEKAIAQLENHIVPEEQTEKNDTKTL